MESTTTKFLHYFYGFTSFSKQKEYTPIFNQTIEYMFEKMFNDINDEYRDGSEKAKQCTDSADPVKCKADINPSPMVFVLSIFQINVPDFLTPHQVLKNMSHHLPGAIPITWTCKESMVLGRLWGHGGHGWLLK